jgi:hypothetical protein
VPAVKVFRRQADNFQTGRQTKPDRHSITAVITVMDNFFDESFQLHTLL